MSSIADEFAGADFGDPRRGERLRRLSTQLAVSPEASFPAALDEGQLEAAYRFFGNPHVSLEGILAPHVKAAWARAAGRGVTLAVHDSTVISFRPTGCRVNVPVTERGTQQFFAHATLAVDGDGTRRPHGVVALSTHDQQADSFHGRWAAQVEDVENKATSPVVHVMDREADDYALLSKFVTEGRRFIVRAQHDRHLDASRRLFEFMGGCETVVTRDAQLGTRKATRRGDSKQRRIHPDRGPRKTRLAFSATTMTIPRPKSASTDLPCEVAMNVVRVSEVNPPVGEKPVEWILLTTEPISRIASVARIVDWYRARWVIEEYFKALKSGCSYEKRQLESFHALRNALGVFAPIAWRLLLLRTEARERPTSPANTVLCDDQIHVLSIVGRVRLTEGPTAREVWLAIARLGGHLPRNGEPGWKVLERGLEKLDALTVGWNLRNEREISDQS